MWALEVTLRSMRDASNSPGYWLSGQFNNLGLAPRVNLEDGQIRAYQAFIQP